MSGRNWQAGVEQMATGVALVGADLRLRWANPALVGWLGLGPRSAIGQSLAVLMADPEQLAQAQRAVSAQRRVQWRGVPLLAVDGRETRVDMSLQPFGGHWLVEVHALDGSLATTSPLSSSLRGFAHEVKNPLAGLRGAAQLLQRRVDSDDLRALASMIIDEADRLGALANRLLRNDGAPQLGAVNIHQLLARVGELLEAESPPPRLQQDYDPSLPDLYGDADRLQQAVLNLARNALEAGASTITFRTRIEHGVRLGERPVRMAMRLDVMDDGHGVPPALRDSLFEPLVSGRPDGSGLGLALSREIAHEHGGELRCSHRGPGAAFSLYLPLDAAADPRSAEQ